MSTTTTRPAAPSAASAMLDGESVLGAYRTMVVARTPDERCLSLQRQVRIASAAREAVRAS